MAGKHDKPVLCVDCIYHCLHQGNEHWCSAESTSKVDLVTGEVYMSLEKCAAMRYDGAVSVCHCRPEGRMFKRR
jgi:hypothetical protein